MQLVWSLAFKNIQNGLAPQCAQKRPEWKSRVNYYYGSAEVEHKTSAHQNTPLTRYRFKKGPAVIFLTAVAQALGNVFVFDKSIL